MHSRHSEFHAAYLPQDSCDFDYDEIDRRLAGNSDPEELPDRGLQPCSRMEEIEHLRSVTRQLVTAKHPHKLVKTLLTTLCPSIY